MITQAGMVFAGHKLSDPQGPPSVRSRDQAAPLARPRAMAHLRSHLSTPSSSLPQGLCTSSCL